MLDWRRAWQIAVGVARGLEYAHERGIIHRNVTPGHVLINDSLSVIKLGDLTLAKAMDGCGERITRPGDIVGNPRYLAPEQLFGDGWVDGRADIYSLGATLYAVLTGRQPFDGPTVVDVMRAVQTGRLDPPSRIHLGVPPMFESVVLRMMARNPEDRYASATELLRALDGVRKYTGMPA
jgi:serine/threonine-protein kinase